MVAGRCKVARPSQDCQEEKFLAAIISSVIIGNFPPVNYRPAGRKRYRHILDLPPPPKSLPPRNEKPPTAVKLPPYFSFTASAEVVTAQKRKTAYRRKITAILRFYRLRRYRYHQKTKNRLPPKKLTPYGITALKVPPSVIPPTKVPPCLSSQKGWLCAS